MKWWFDAWRTAGGPTWYSYSNGTPVNGDFPTIAIYVIFITLFLAFLIISLGVRKERVATFLTVTLSLFVGSVILVANQGSCWHVSESVIKSDYISFSGLRIEGKLGVYVGLNHINVTFESKSNNNAEALLLENDSSSPPSGGSILNNDIVDYNERFHWDGPEEMRSERKEALQKGLPYPILTVVDYFSSDEGALCWGRMYRLAGYYSSILVWASFASWLLMNLLVVVVPLYGAYMMIMTGLLMLSSSVMYYLLLPGPGHELSIQFEKGGLKLQFGWSYWMVVIAGSLCSFVGLLIAFVDLLYPNSFSTFLELDYDTLYGRHILDEGSVKGDKSRTITQEDPIDTGIAFGRENVGTLPWEQSIDNDKGLVNYAFEMDPPKSPCTNCNRCMQKRRVNEIENNSLMNAMARNPNLARLPAPSHVILNEAMKNRAPAGGKHDGVKIPKSVSFRRQSRLEQIFHIRNRNDSDDESIASSHSEGPPPPPRDNIHQFQVTPFGGIINSASLL